MTGNSKDSVGIIFRYKTIALYPVAGNTSRNGIDNDLHLFIHSSQLLLQTLKAVLSAAGA